MGTHRHRARNILRGLPGAAALSAATLGLLLGVGPAPGAPPGAPPPLPPILFVAQPPFPGDFGTVNSVFGNHRATTQNAPRGGDLMIRYGNGSLRSLTAEAGFGLVPGQEIAVREPTVHWSGAKALFSMAVGGTTPQDAQSVRWQIYEVSGLASGAKAKIVKLPQPGSWNNVSPLYGTDERILFTSDLPRNLDPATSPQLDEYESDATVTGIWSMKRDGTDLRLLDHAPSGDFSPIVDSAGRIVTVRWDHLQRDQQNAPELGDFGAFNYASELSPAALPTPAELFPEPMFPPQGSQDYGHSFNFFFPWQLNEDGSGMETLNHVGRHELMAFAPAAQVGFPNFYKNGVSKLTGLFLHVAEDPKAPGRFLGTTAPEFFTHGAGQIVGLNGGLGVDADSMFVTELTDPATRQPLADGAPVPPGHPGLFRDPLPLSTGDLVAVRTSDPHKDAPTGPGPLPALYDFHLVRMAPAGSYLAPAERLLPSGVVKPVSYFDPWSGQQVTYAGPLWELEPAEARPRKKPKKHTDPLPAIERAILEEELGGPAGVKRLQGYLRTHRRALVVSRDVTRRADKQQEFNLKIAGSSTQTALPGATPTEIAWLQFLQGDLLRGYTQHFAGRRPLAVPMHTGSLPKIAGAPAGAARLGADGSMAAFVPSRRALTWQLTKEDGTPVVRERFWVTFAPGEMRACANCHGLNAAGDVVLGEPKPTNPPQALRDLAKWWSVRTGNGSVGDTVGAFDPAAKAFALRNANKAGPPDAAFAAPAAGSGWAPLAGDWDGDGVTTLGFYEPATSTFHLRNTLDPGPDDVTLQFGNVGFDLVPISGDWDGDGADGVGLYDPATGTFRLKDLLVPGPASAVFAFGPAGSAPLAGDFDGDGRDSVGVFVPATGEWLLRNATAAGPADLAFPWPAPAPGAIPIAGDWNADGITTPGFYDPATGTYSQRNKNAKSGPVVKFAFGPANGLPLAGDWNGN